MNRKISITLILILFFTGFMNAQEAKPEKKHEIGIGISGMNSNFNLMYKFGTERTLCRIKMMHIDNFLEETNVGLSIGAEFRKPVSEHVNFIYGLDLQDAFRYEPELIINIFGINAVLGANYRLTKNVLIGAEITPLVGLTAVKPNNSHVWERDFYYQISNAGAELYIAVQF